MYFNKKCFTALCYCILLTHPVFAATLTHEKLQDDVLVAWSKYLCEMTGKELVCVEKTFDGEQLTNSSPITTSLTSVFPNFRSESVRNNGVQNSWCVNSKYTFTLSKKSEGEVWIVKKVEPIARPTVIKNQTFPLLKSIEKSDQNLFSWGLSQMAVGLKMNLPLWLPSYFKSPIFNIDSVEEVFEDNERLVHVKFTYEPEEYSPGELMRSGEVYLMPDHYWLIKKAQYISLEPDKVTRVPCELNIDYGELTLDSLPLPKKSVLILKKYGKGGQDYRMEWTYSWKQNINVADKEFTLSHYGLPEPDFGERRTNRFRFILIAAGLILISIALWQMYQKRKEQK